MSDVAAGFQSLPEEFQETIRLAQQRYHISITPLQTLTGGWSGAIIYLVSVAFQEPDRVEHFVMKLDRKNEKAKADEIRRHNEAARLSPPAFAEKHMAQMMFERVEHAGMMAIFYAIAGQSLHQYRPLSAFDRQNQLEKLFQETYHQLLEGWNAAHTIHQAVSPQQMLEQWLGFRLKPGGSIETFLADICGVPPDIPGFLVQGHIYPNPLAYAREASLWATARPMDVALGLQHGDLNTNNLLVKFDRNGETVEGFYLIDFALFKAEMPLLYDLRYLEACYLVFQFSQAPLNTRVNLITRFADRDLLDPDQMPVDAAGLCAIINTSRLAFDNWISANHPTLRDDLWGQYLLAGVAAGLNYTHKATLSSEERMVGLIFAAANLKRFTTLFGIPEPAEGRQIFEPDQPLVQKPSSPDRRPAVAKQGNVEKTPHNLPAAYSTFIGRETELAAARRLLSSPNVRLVTFSGPGGVGKTRLALQTAAGLLDEFPNGVFLVPLAEINEPELVVSRIAQALGVRSSSQPLLETLKDFLCEKQLLLILDNLEQVTAAAPMILDLLSNAPGLHVLGTSRVVLRVRGEHEFPVPPMKVPNPNGQSSIALRETYESVQLFVDRARAVNPTFAYTEENATAIIEICRRLEGLPLAIELAAARVKMFPPRVLLGRLNNRLAVLTGGARDLPDRQQALRKTLDWSHSLLSPEEQILFARLSVFAGGFTLEAAEAVCNLAGDLDILTGIEALMDNSLLRQEVGIDGQPRFRMLETMREYALEQLKARGEQAAVEQSHALYYVNKISDEVNLFSLQATSWLDWLESEHDNLQAMLAWGQTKPEMTDVLPMLGTQLVWFWYRRGYFSEGCAWAEQWLDLTAGQGFTRSRALALQNSSFMSGWRGDLNTALTRSQESLNIMLQLEDEVFIPYALFSMGVVHINMGNDAAAHPLIKEAQAIFEEAGNDYFRVVTLVHLGNVSLGLGNAQEARDWLEKAYTISQKLQEKWLLSFVLNNMGEVARVQGDYTNARRYYQKSEALLREMGDKGDLARLVNSLGYVAQHEGEQQEAKEKFQESLAMFRRLGNKRGIAETLAGLAGLRLLEGKVRQAAQLLSAAEAMMNASGAAWWPADRVEIDRNRATIQASLGEEAFAAEWAEGRAMRYEQAIALAVENSQHEPI